MRHSNAAVVVWMLSLSIASPLAAQASPKLLEVSGVVGFTSVNVENWDKDNIVDDWGVMASGVSARLFTRQTQYGRLGFEYSYRYHFWYTIQYCSFSSCYYPTIDESSHNFSVLLRRPSGSKAWFDVGAGLLMFDGWTDLGLHFGYTRLLHDGPKNTVPISFRFDPVLDSDAMLFPLTVNLGIGFKLGPTPTSSVSTARSP